MYAARPHIQKVTGQELNRNYFTQTLLPDYLKETGVDWDVVYDARGHFNEPHAGRQLRNRHAGGPQLSRRLPRSRSLHAGFSQAKVETSGPSGNFGAVLFIEKEGFDPLLKAAQIAERFDLAIMSHQGHERRRGEGAGRRDVLRPRHSAAAAARLRQERLLDRRDTAARHPPLRIPEQHQDHRPRSRASPTSRRWGWRASTSTIRRATNPR